MTLNPSESTPSLHKQTITLLRNRPRTLTFEMIAKETATTVHWLERLAADGFEEPGVNKIERLYRYLTNYKPEA